MFAPRWLVPTFSHRFTQPPECYGMPVIPLLYAEVTPGTVVWFNLGSRVASLWMWRVGLALEA